MSEKLTHHSPEQHRSPEHHAEHEQKHLRELQEKAERAEGFSDDTIENIKRSIESTAVSGKEYANTEKDAKPTSSFGITKHLKKDAYKRTLRKAQSHLSKPEKSFSKVIHTPTIEKVSDVAAKTVARPNGILFGAIGSFIGTLFVFYMSKHSGFTYNYLLFIIIFVGGYFVGLIVELLVRAVKRPARH